MVPPATPRWRRPSARTVLVVVAALLAGGPAPALADFFDGLAAYDGGDLAAARAEWRAAAEAGDTDAMVALAGLLQSGEAGRAEPAAAMVLYRRAALAGNTAARLNLGDMLARGAGVARDSVAGYAWLWLAGEAGNGWAAEAAVKLAPALGAAEFARAKSLAESWRQAQ